MSLRNKTAIVTGGARGIGFATVEKFLNEGANVVIVDIDEECMNQAEDTLNMYKNRLTCIVGDVTNKDSIESVIVHTIEHFQIIDILVNNAGIARDAQLTKMSEEQWNQVIDINLKGVFLMTQRVAQVMKEQKNGGVILNASSVVGLYGNFGQTNYAATKFGINGMTKTWAKELGKYQIRVNSVAPGFILTDLTEGMPEKILNRMKEQSPLKMLGSPADIANAYAFLASKEAKFITGTILNVDGGVVI